MKKAFLYGLFLSFGLFTLGSGIRDENNVLSEQETAELELLCREIYDKYKLEIYVYLITEDNKPRYVPASGRDTYLYAYLDLSKHVVRLEMRKIPNDLQVLHQQVFFQWIETYLRENRSIYKGLKQTLVEIEKAYSRKKLIRDQALEQATIEADEFTRKTRILVNFFEALFIVFVLLFTLKGFRSGNQYEIVEYYGLSRLTPLVKVGGGMAFFMLASFWLAWVVPYEELAIVLVGLAFTAYPLMVGLGLLIKIPEDIHTISNLKNQDTSLSLGQTAFLGHRRTPTEYLMEFSFYEAVFNRSIALLISSYEHMHREVVEFHIQKGEPKSKIGPDAAIFLEKSSTEPKKLSTYLKEVYKTTGRFKAYRKDVLIKPLVAAGYINKWGWVFNVFILTEKGQTFQKKIKERIAQQEKLINHGLNRPENLDKVLLKLNKYCLLVMDFEKRLTELHNMVVETGLTQFAMQQPTGILFDYRLSLRAFNSQLKAAYFYRLPWSWNDHDANEGY
ncbi:MAG: hypothetical protein R8G66_27340 [Cytophagales bacterium]|nr:hypothetical protein [Cytophagales bacterium]